MDTNPHAHTDTLTTLAARFFPPVSNDDGLPEAAVAAAEARLGLSLPARLRALYREFGLRDDLLRASDRLFALEFLTVADGVLVFLSDAPGLRYFGIRAEDVAKDDAPVVVSGSGGAAAWKPARRALSDALRSLLLVNAANGGMPWHGAAETPSESLDALGAEWERVGGAGGGDAAFYLRDGRVVHTVPAKKGKILVCAGARTAGALHELSETLGTPWAEKRRRPDAPPEADEGLVDEHADARRTLRQRAVLAASAAEGGAACCASCGGLLRTWADTARGVCGLCGHALPATFA